MEYDVELLKLSDTRIDLARKYAIQRKKYGEVKSEIDILYASRLLALLEKKKNLGYDLGLLMLISEEHEFGMTMLSTMYKDMIKHYNNYKAVEKMLDAIETKIMSIQSIMKYNRDCDTYGGKHEMR
jgi:hypothetical protein